MVPEIVQTSEMDCGPAALACLLTGLGVPASYSLLREACQTDVDGTSVDTLEDVANACGVDAEQVIVPLDHIGLPEASLTPGVVITRTDTGLPHFVLAWRTVGPLLQVMDPRVGRRWLRSESFHKEVYRHEMALPAVTWTGWATSEALTVPLARRLDDLGLAARQREELIERALDLGNWQSIAELDAAVRLTAALKRGRAVTGKRAAARVLAELLDNPTLIPDAFRFARAAPLESDGTVNVLVRGAIVLKAGPAERAPSPESLPPTLSAALNEPPERPTRDLFELLRRGGSRNLYLLATGSFASGAIVVGEGLLLWRLIRGGGSLALLLGLALLLLALETAVIRGSLAIGRRLEIGLRRALEELLPRLPDRYLSSRPTSDLAERAHRMHVLRQLPSLLAEMVRSVGEIVALAIAIAVLDPPSWPLAVLAAVASAGLPFALQPFLAERDQRVRNHAGAMARLTLDTLLGLFAIKAHRAGEQVGRQHNDQLEYWRRAARASYRAIVATDGVQLAVGFGVSTLMILGARARLGGGEVLLLAFWAVSLTLAGQTLGLAGRQYPLQRNIALRFFEPLRAGEQTEEPTFETAAVEPPGPGGAEIELKDVAVVLAGQTVLDGINLTVNPGEHVAIVGRSGAGKSTLAGLLLGWYQPAAGKVVVDHTPLEGAALVNLRRFTAWVDPTIQIWNHSLDANLAYGNWGPSPLSKEEVLQRTGLAQVAANLSSAEVPLGEGGGLVSGGEGQRVRLARALLRPGVRLVILDEPLRGLDRSQRSELLGYCREVWRDATMVCVTHDVAETVSFDRVVVVEGGRIVENDAPERLAADNRSAYRTLLDAERDLAESTWGAVGWRRLYLSDGILHEQSSETGRVPQ